MSSRTDREDEVSVLGKRGLVTIDPILPLSCLPRWRKAHIRYTDEHWGGCQIVVLMKKSAESVHSHPIPIGFSRAWYSVPN